MIERSREGDMFEQMKCGNCGASRMKLWARRAADNREAFTAFRLKCTKCSVQTDFVLSAPKITQNWHSHPDSPGSHCIGIKRRASK